MGVIAYLIALALGGLVVGAFARLALPGRDPMSIWQTMAVGIAGSFIAGLLFWAVSGEPGGGGFLLSLVAATAIVYGIRRSRGGGLTSPGRRDRLGRGNRS